MSIDTNMLQSDGESTPLLSSAKGGGRLKLVHPNVNDSADGASTRRRFNQQQSVHQAQHFASPFSLPTQSQDDSFGESRKGRFRTMYVKFSSYSKLVHGCLFSVLCSRLSGYRWKSSNGDRTVPDRIIFNSRVRTHKPLYYEDDYNDLPWGCTFGTKEDNGIWLNTTDLNGIVMSGMVWVLIVYSGFTVTLLAQNNSLRPMIATIYCTLCALALASHAKTVFTDPGAVPHTAVPTEEQGLNQTEFALCAICLTFKPQRCHHCRICNRCICGMDHHCPWMNNCIGSGNLKHFILFLLYVWMLAAYAFAVFSINYFFCATEECVFTPVLVQLVRVMSFLSVGALLFTSNMIANVTWGIMTGTGTIDRMKKRENDTVWDSDEESIPLTDVFGIGGWYTWPFPIDPLFDDYDNVMAYSTTQRLLREKILRETKPTLVKGSAGDSDYFVNV